MSCNCTCNPKCTTDPCAICTPPGVTGLTTCKPVDSCDEKVNIECVKYNGIDFSCFGVNVNNGDSLISVLLAILNYYFPPEYCCKLDGTLIFPATTTTTSTSTTTTTTSTSTTSTSTTTTTTTATPCICYKLTNNKEGSISYSYVDCVTRKTIASSVASLTTKYQCAVEKSITQNNLIQDTIGPCSAGCPPTTSTTTTSSTTTSTSTTSTSSTTTTTTVICKCYKISNPTNTILYYDYTTCGALNRPIVPITPSGIAIVPGDSDYFCARPGSIIFDIGLVLDPVIGDCSAGCPPVNPPPDINCTNSENLVIYNGSLFNTINGFTGPAWFAWAGGPVLPGGIEKGIHGGYVGNFGVDITVTPGGSGGCLKVLVNGVVQDTASIFGSTIYTLTINAPGGSCVQIILNDDPC